MESNSKDASREAKDKESPFSMQDLLMSVILANGGTCAFDKIYEQVIKVFAFCFCVLCLLTCFEDKELGFV